MGNGSSYVDGEGTGAGIAGRRGLVPGWQHVKALLVAGFLAGRVQFEGLVLWRGMGQLAMMEKSDWCGSRQKKKAKLA